MSLNSVLAFVLGGSELGQRNVCPGHDLYHSLRRQTHVEHLKQAGRISFLLIEVEIAPSTGCLVPKARFNCSPKDVLSFLDARSNGSCARHHSREKRRVKKKLGFDVSLHVKCLLWGAHKKRCHEDASLEALCSSQVLRNAAHN